MNDSNSRNFDYLKQLQFRVDEAANKSEEQRAESNRSSTNRKSEENLVFIDDFNIVKFRTDINSINFPLFSLRKNPVTEESIYAYKDYIVTITPSQKGQATIHDKDIWIYCVSKLVQALYEKKDITSVVRFKVAGFLKSVGRNLSGRSHIRLKESLDRLDGTRIKIEYLKGKKTVTHKFGLLEGWTIIENQNGRMVYVQVNLPHWLVNSLKQSQVRKISEKYFLLSSPIHRRLYEIACKHCNNNPEWPFKVETLQHRCGSTSSIAGFRRIIKALAENDAHFPDYRVKYDPIKDLVIFINRDPSVHEKAAKRISKNNEEIKD